MYGLPENGCGVHVIQVGICVFNKLCTVGFLVVYTSSLVLL